MSLVVDNLPVLYNDKMYELNDMCAKAVEPFVEPTIEEHIESYQEEPPEERRSGIIENLYYTLRFSESDYKSIQTAQKNGKIRHDSALDADKSDYYNNRVQVQAEEIFMAINALIQRDNWNPQRFGNYKMVKRMIDAKSGMEKALALNMLRLCGLTAIPMDIRFEQTKIIEPSITSPVRTQ
jgi:hypothetical protein